MRRHRRPLAAAAAVVALAAPAAALGGTAQARASAELAALVATWGRCPTAPPALALAARARRPAAAALRLRRTRAAIAAFRVVAAECSRPVPQQTVDPTA
jgi:hypothetical protein